MVASTRATAWVVPRIWSQETVAVLASGPSMNAKVAAAVRGNCRVIAVNTTFRLAPWADMVYAADAAWWKKYHDEVAELKFPMRVTCSDIPFADVYRLRDAGRDGFDPDPANVRTGGNSGYQAIHVAAHTGTKRILLCGFDMHGGHWHARHEAPLREHGEGIYARWLPRFATLAPGLCSRGIEVLNCTPGSALKIWPFVSLEAALSPESVE